MQETKRNKSDNLINLYRAQNKKTSYAINASLFFLPVDALICFLEVVRVEVENQSHKFQINFS